MFRIGKVSFKVYLPADTNFPLQNYLVVFVQNIHHSRHYISFVRNVLLVIYCKSRKHLMYSLLCCLTTKTNTFVAEFFKVVGQRFNEKS